MVDQTTGWQPDPYGAHEFRFFSADGKPTLLVMDGGKTSYDRPPTAEPPPDLERPSSPRPVPPPAPEPPLSPEPEPPPAPVTPTALAPAATAFGADQVSTRSTAHTTDADNVASAAALLQPRTSILAVTDFVDDRSVGGVGQRSPEAISRPLKIAYGIVFVALALSLLGLVYVHFHHAGGRPSEHAEGTTTTTSAPRTTTTTVVLPTALKPGAEAAATTLVSIGRRGTGRQRSRWRHRRLSPPFSLCPMQADWPLTVGAAPRLHRSSAHLGLLGVHHRMTRSTKSMFLRPLVVGTSARSRSGI